ncbi:MAG TPA: lamin tail domain-containing protein, partial [Thermoplasmatales archaeon]|nr:lamin tail domain-containing protein [Thermoplasmatales archaeon]HEX08511.1 lamin tail domain-containing protein [Thermoplasmatales archaeon]
PTQNDNFNEWIELYNPTNNPVDVDGWRIVDNNEEDLIEGDDVNGNGTTIIPPHSYAIITDSNTHVYDSFTIPENAVKLHVEDSSIGNNLGNTEDKLILKNATGAIVDAIEWGSDYSDVPGSPIPNVNQGHSIARYTNIDTDNTLVDFYDEDNPTPGSENM